VPGEPVIIVHPETGVGLSTVPWEFLAPEQQDQVRRERRGGGEWWCVPMATPTPRSENARADTTPAESVDLATRLLVKDLRAGRSLARWTVGGLGHLAQWNFSGTFRLWLADYLEQGHLIPPWLTAEHKVSPAIPE